MQRIALISDSPDLHHRMSSALATEAPVDRLDARRPGLPGELGRLKPALVLFDLELEPQVSVRDILAAANGADLHTEVVAVGDAANANEVIQALRAGSVDFLDRREDAMRLREQIVRRLLSIPERARSEAGDFTVVIGAQAGGGANALSVNLALLQAQADPDVLLIDCALPASEAGIALGLMPTYSLWDASRDAERLDRTLLGAALVSHKPTGLRVLPLAARATDEASLSPESFLKALATIRPLFRKVVMNVGGIRHPQLLASILSSATRIYLVCPQVLTAIRDAKDLLASLPDGLDFRDRTVLVVDEYSPDITLTDAQVRKSLAISRSFHLPPARVDLANSLNIGNPLVMRLPNAPYVQALLAGVGEAVRPAQAPWTRWRTRVEDALGFGR